jgi:hypothetical protein
VNWKEMGIIDKPAPFPIYLEEVKSLLIANTLIISIVKNGNETEISIETQKDWQKNFTKG